MLSWSSFCIAARLADESKFGYALISYFCKSPKDFFPKMVYYYNRPMYMVNMVSMTTSFYPFVNSYIYPFANFYFYLRLLMSKYSFARSAIYVVKRSYYSFTQFTTISKTLGSFIYVCRFLISRILRNFKTLFRKVSC